MRLNILLVIMALSISGCASTQTNKTATEIHRLKGRIDELEDELQEKNKEVNYLQGQLENVKINDPSAFSDYEAKYKGDVSQMTSKNIQIALKNSGFYSGLVDGKIGKETKKAIRAFQEENGLKVDGIVGKETWVKLSKYLTK